MVGLRAGDDVSQAGLALVATTIITAVVHTLIPDHWLPFVLVSRAERWSVRRTVSVTTASALLHVVVSIVLGLAIVLLGRGAGQAVMGVAEGLGDLTGWLLITFGLAYMIWFLLRGGHVHSFGMHPHHAPNDPDPPEAGRRTLTGYALAFIVGFNPCILVIPIVYGASRTGRLTLVAVSLAFAMTTILTMVGATLVGHHGTSRLTSPFLTRYGEALSGGIIALTGLALMLIEVDFL